MASIAVHVTHELLNHYIEKNSTAVNIYDPKNSQRQKIIKMYTKLGEVRTEVMKLQKPSINDQLREKVMLLLWFLEGSSDWFLNRYPSFEKFTDNLVMRFIYSLPNSGIANCDEPMSKKCIENGIKGTEVDLTKILSIMKKSNAELEDLIQITFSDGYVNETRIQYITNVSIGGVSLSNLLRMYHSVVVLDNQRPTGIDGMFGGGTHSRANAEIQSKHNRCKAITKAGTRCKHQAQQGLQFCHIHKKST